MDEKNKNEVMQIEISQKFPVLIDTFNFKTTYKTEQEYGIANYHPLYFGIWTDTIYPYYEIPRYSVPPPSSIIKTSSDTLFKADNELYSDLYKNNYEKYSIYYQVLPLDDYIHWDSSKLEITIDTNTTIRNIDFKKFQDNTFSFYAFPVIISNKTDANIAIGYGSHLALILEALDENGDWKQIENKYTYMCGTGLPIIVLPNNEIVLTSVPIYKGAYLTDLRLKIGNNYSSTFKGYIHLKQFKDKKE